MLVQAVAGKRILVLGLGVTGQAVVTVLGQLDRTQAPSSITSLDARNPDATYSSFEHINLDSVDLIIASPGWPPHSPVLAQAVERGVPVWSEIELAWQLRVERNGGGFAPWIGVTGTNGKTTTIGMVESILQADGRNAVAVGNVGRPVIEVARDPQVEAIALELSSFQLHFTHTLALDAAAVLNIAPDHIDWHGNYQEYALAKGKIYEHVKTACVYNVHDVQTRTLVENADVASGARAIGFTLGSPQRSECGVVEDVLVDRAFHMDFDNPLRHQNAAEIGTLADLEHLGAGGTLPPHIVSNALAAAALTRAVGVSQSAVRDGLRNYQPGGHRIETVASVLAEGGEIHFVDDSKATNAHAATASLATFPDSSVVWIAGGLAKGAEFDALIREAESKLRSVVLIGLDAKPLADSLAKHAPHVPVLRVDPNDESGAPLPGAVIMERAVEYAARAAQTGDTVLMAPACASMDQFTSYAERGDAFASAARLYAGQVADNAKR